MQLNRSTRGRVSRALGAMTANLLVATGALAQSGASAPPPSPAPVDAPSDVADDLGLTRIDSAVLFYSEDHGRVHATEPSATVTVNGSRSVLSMTLLYDAVSGATPNGAAPWNAEQNFFIYRAPANTLPLYPYFSDRRKSLSVDYERVLDDARVNVGAYVSKERDYLVYSAQVGASRDFFNKNTTVSVGLQFERDKSSPAIGGTPDPFSPFGLRPRNGSAYRHGQAVVASVTQVMTRSWLTQISYELGYTRGYHTEPYRALSLVDPVTGAPVRYIYEKRPNRRLRQSIYWTNRVAIGPTAFSASARAYHDDWGVDSATVELSERIPLSRWLYVEPAARYYHQGSARFFRDYLLAGQPLPENASSDFKLSRFSATTFGARVGVRTPYNGEFYVLADRYRQHGASRRPYAPRDLANLDFFGGVKATKVVAGYTFAF